MEAAAEEYFRKIEALGGVLAAIEKGFFQQEIADAAYAYQQAIEMGERVVVGVNRFASGEPLNIELLKIDPAVERRQVERLQKLKERRDNIAVAGALQRLAKAASGSENLIPFILEAAKLYATEGEIIGTLKEVFGEYREQPIF